MAEENYLKEFVAKLIEFAPIGTIWGIQGIYEQESINNISSFSKETNLNTDEIYPDYWIEICENNKAKLIQLIKNTNIVFDIIEHQFFSFENELIFKSYDAFSHNILKVNKWPMEQFAKYNEDDFLESE